MEVPNKDSINNDEIENYKDDNDNSIYDLVFSISYLI